MTSTQRQMMIELCAGAATELREAVEGFRLDFDENGFEHLDEALMLLDEIVVLRRQAAIIPHADTLTP